MLTSEHIHVIDESEISEKDLSYCFEFHKEDVHCRKDTVIQKVFSPVVHSISSSIMDQYSCILCDTSCSSSIDYSSLYSFSPYVIVLSYYTDGFSILSFLKSEKCSFHLRYRFLCRLY